MHIKRLPILQLKSEDLMPWREEKQKNLIQVLLFISLEL